MPTTWSADETLQVFPVPGKGTEDVLVSDGGLVYTGTDDGVIHELDPASGGVRPVGRTEGRPLGLEWLSDGRLLVCDAYAGLRALGLRTGDVQPLTDQVAGHRMVFCNNADVHSDDTIYFTDSSRLHPIDRWRAEVVEDTHTGRLLQRAPDGEVTVLADGLRFANGVALAPDESYVAVAETAGRAVVRHWLAGPQRGRTDLLVGDLPGYPDNISTGSDGLIWVAIGSGTQPLVELLQRRAPLPVRRLAWRAPEALQPKAGRPVRVMAFDGTGRLVHDRSFGTEGFHFVSGVREEGGTVWLGSLVAPAVACFEVR